MTTNGTCLDERLTRELISAGLTHFIFSVDGSTAETHDIMVGVPGSFIKIKSAINILQKISCREKSRIKWGINTVVTKYNIMDLGNLLSWASKNGVYRITLLNLHRFSFTKSLGLDEEAEELYERDVLPNLIERGNNLGLRVIPIGYLIMPDGTLKKFSNDLLNSLPCFQALE